MLVTGDEVPVLQELAQMLHTVWGYSGSRGTRNVGAPGHLIPTFV